MISYASHPSHFISEVEVFAGCILGKNGAQSKRQREYSVDMKDKHNRDVEYTVRCIKQGDSDGSNDEALERSIACLFVSLSNGRRRPKGGDPGQLCMGGGCHVPAGGGEFHEAKGIACKTHGIAQEVTLVDVPDAR